MMARAFSKLISCTSPSICLGVSMLVRHNSRHVRSGWSADFYRSILPWEGVCLLKGQTARAALLCRSADFERLEGCRDGYHAYCTMPSCIFFNLEDKARKGGDLTCACSPIMLPVTVRSGGRMAVALNALAPVPTAGGVVRFCARGLQIRSALFP